MKVLYFVHDLCDAAVKKRVLMLQTGGADVVVVGFYRSSVAPANIGSAEVIPLTRTYDASFLHRLKSVFYAAFFSSHYLPYIHDADVIICRNLEMLLLGRKVKRILKSTPLIYESLDIHRLLLGEGKFNNVLRFVERWAAKKSDLLITSSPGFIDNYFSKLNKLNKPILLVENKYFDTEANVAEKKLIKNSQQNKVSYVIGWFGAIRCCKSLSLLSEITRKLEGKVRVIIRGRPAYTEFKNFLALVESEPYIEFKGEYTFPDDLAEIYREVDFSWAIDFFEEGLNSEWLLPNRIYEGGLYGCIPLTIEGTQTADYLDKKKLGVTLDREVKQSCTEFFEELVDADFCNLQELHEASSTYQWSYTQEQCQKLVRVLEKLRSSHNLTCNQVYEI